MLVRQSGYWEAHIPAREERLAGGLMGLLVGDALGVPYEFKASAKIPPHDQIEMVPPSDFPRTYPGVSPGTWSDDGAQALCLLDSLLNGGGLDLTDFSNRLINWYEHGYMAVDHSVFDVGVQTAEAIARLRAGTSPRFAGGNHQYSQGNGSLMRVLPLALWHHGPDDDLAMLACEQSLPTHGHPVVLVCCAQYVLWARGILRQSADPWSQAIRSLEAFCASRPELQPSFHAVFRDDAEREPKGSGYVVDSIFSARYALDQGGYEQVVRAAIALGNDTDTTACIAGGLAGLRDGIGAIPERWRATLRGQGIVQPLLEQLIAADR